MAENVFEGLSEGMQKEMQKVFADKIAEAALSMLDEETIKNYADQLFYSLKWNDNKTQYWHNDANIMQAIVFNSFTDKVGKKLADIVEEGLFDTEAKETAERIYKESLETAEKYIVEALALRMASVSTDFNGKQEKLNIHLIVQEVMQNHMRDSHTPRY